MKKNFNSRNNRKNKQRTINDIYEQLAILVDTVSENRHIETMEAFHICNRMLSGLAISEDFEDYALDF